MVLEDRSGSGWREGKMFEGSFSGLGPTDLVPSMGRRHLGLKKGTAGESGQRVEGSEFPENAEIGHTKLVPKHIPRVE